MKKRIIHLASILLVAIGTYAQTEVTVGIMRGKDYGVTYMLPKSVIELTVKATKHTCKPGELYKYAERYLRINNAISHPYTYWTLEEVKANTIGVPDKERTYFVKLKDKTTAPLMELTEDGIVRSINMPFIGKDTEATVTPPTAPAQPVDPRSFFTEEMLMTSSVAKMAELAAKEIYDVRESKSALIRGEADFMPQDGTQLQIMLDNLNQHEAALTEMFAGTTTAEPQTFTFRLEPKEMKQTVAFRFSRSLGVLESDNLAGEPIYIDLTDLKILNFPPESGEKKVGGVSYNVPGKAHITLSFNRQKLFEGDLPVTQFGSTECLAPVLFNKNATTKVLFDTATGGLLKVERE